MPQYATLGKRAVALVIDWVAVDVIMILLVLVGALVSGDPVAGISDALWALLVPMVYEVGMVASKYQATLGKLALGIRVSDQHGAPLGLKGSTIRYVAKILSGFLLGLGYLMAVFTENRQTLHDLVAQSWVLEGSVPIEPAASEEFNQ
ncbi:MAG: RDD family protein [bacterium]|nr:RDD family protein [bacterium]